MKKTIIALFSASLLFVSCSKDSESSNSSAFSPSVTKLRLDSNTPVSLDQNSQETSMQLSQMEAYMDFGSNFMNNPSNRINPSLNSNTTKTWTYGEFLVTYIYNDSGNQYSFEYTITKNGNIYYSITGWEKKDNSAGSWDFNVNSSYLGDPDTTNYNISFDWNKNSTNDYHYELSFDMGKENLMLYACNINHDKSGDFLYTFNSEKEFGAKWDKTGHGESTDYTTSPVSVSKF